MQSDEGEGRRWALPGPSLKDWAMLAVSLALTALGVVVFPRDWRLGALVILMFGGGALMFLARIVRLLRGRRPDLVKASLPGGVEIGVSRGRFYLIGAALLAIGGLGAAYTSDSGEISMRSLFWLLIAVGAGLVVGLAFNLLPRQSLRLDSEGLTIQQYGDRFLIPWDNIGRMTLGEVARNPMLLIDVVDEAQVRSLGGATPAKVAKRLNTYRKWYGADVAFMPLLFGLDPQLTLAAFAGYIEDPASRDQLAPMARLEGR